ncbi:MAG TPA: hypothetical protein VHP33_17585 [Polyangiaceae bacterium]|nr:hypothetical protein [Polyangiaceae bacterium]
MLLKRQWFGIGGVFSPRFQIETSCRALRLLSGLYLVAVHGRKSAEVDPIAPDPQSSTAPWFELCPREAGFVSTPQLTRKE